MADNHSEQKGLSNELVAQIRKQALSEVTKWVIVAFVALVGIAASGWWFYLQQKIDQYITIRVAGVPSAAVVAFDQASGCPKGWSPFSDAAGRMIVGTSIGQQATSGGIEHLYREINKRDEMHKLTEAELPPLKFTFTVNAAEDGNSGGDRYDAGGKNYAVVKKLPTLINLTSSGKGEAFSIMPPYIALFYCKKD